MRRFLPLLCYALAACGTGITPAAPVITTCEEAMGLNVNFEGVYRGPNRHSQVPPGAAERAENLVSYNKGHAECVTGMENLASAYTTGSERFSSGLPYDGYTIERTSTGALYRRADDGTLTAITTGIDPPSGVARVPFAEAGGDLYLATDEGLKVLDGATTSPAAVGLTPPFPPSPVTTFAAGAYEVPDGGSVAYRVTVARQDNAGLYITSAPSGRGVVVNNDGQPQTIGLTQFLTEDDAAGDKYQLWRTGTSTTDTPGDVMYLVYERILDSTDVSTGYFSLIDSTPDELRGEPLYTNGTQGGIQRQNDRPPLAKVIVGFDDYLMLLNVQDRHRFIFRMLAVPTAGDTITIAGETYTADVSGNYPAGIFAISGGTVSESIMYTSKALVDAINRKTANTSTYAYYLSSENDPPGIIMVERRDVTAASFTAVASVGQSWEPPLSTAQSSTATIEPSGIWVSKRGEHYAFPPLRSSTATYRFRVGTKGRDILAAVPLREAVIVFTNGEGVFKVQRVGNELWRADQINATVQLLIPGSVAVVDNQVIALTTKGIVAVDTGGVEEIDLPIKQAVADILALSSDTLVPYTFAVGDDARNRYILYHPEANSDTTATHAWVYNGTTGTWTERTDDASGGFVDPDTDLLYLGSATSNTLTRERTGTDSQVYKRPDNSAIPVRLEWTVMDEGDPGASKQFTELRLLTEEAITGNVTFNCTNDLGGTESTTAVATSEPFARAWVPNGCQWTSRLKVDIQRSVLGEAFTVVGMKTLLAGMEDGSFTR